MISLEGGKKTWRSECGGGGREREVANEKSEAVKIRAPHAAMAPRHLQTFLNSCHALHEARSPHRSKTGDPSSLAIGYRFSCVREPACSAEPSHLSDIG
jgi:hypothetical protein